MTERLTEQCSPAPESSRRQAHEAIAVAAAVHLHLGRGAPPLIRAGAGSSAWGLAGRLERMAGPDRFGPQGERSERN